MNEKNRMMGKCPEKLYKNIFLKVRILGKSLVKLAVIDPAWGLEPVGTGRI
jgi:hypothetical protein